MMLVRSHTLLTYMSISLQSIAVDKITPVGPEIGAPHILEHPVMLPAEALIIVAVLKDNT